jgi:hypothetical protein
VDAVARQFLDRDVVPDIAGGLGVGERVAEQAVQLLLGPRRLGSPVQQRAEVVGAVPRAHPADVRVRRGHGVEAVARTSLPFLQGRERREVAGDEAFVPGGDDRLHVGEVLVERGPSDAGLLGHQRHRHREQAALGDQRPCRVQDRVAHLTAVLLDGVVPQLRHL